MEPQLNFQAKRVIRVAQPSITNRELVAVNGVLRLNQLSQGPKVAEFERELSNTHGRKFGISCNSGTTALHVALVAMGAGPGKQVILPTLTMVAVANAVVYTGATPVFVDSLPSGNIDLEEAAERITSETAAVICPHLYGLPTEGMADFVRKDLILEDCAESHYARTKNSDGQMQPVGSFGKLATFSFYANKIIATGEGGMVIGDDPAIAERLNSLRAHAFTAGEHFNHKELAFGYRMTEMQGAIGLAQHQRYGEILSRRKQIADLYLNTLPLSPGGDISVPPTPNGKVWWVFPVLIGGGSPITRNGLRDLLANAGVETRTYFKPLHRQGHLAQFATASYPIADQLAARGLYLPLYPDMSDEDVRYICNVIIAAL